MADRTVLSKPPEARCRACDTPLPSDSATCAHCGAVFGEENRCPHCRVIAGADVRAGIGHCRVCGGPRIAVDEAGIVRSGRENEWLERARSQSLGIVVSRVGAYAALGSATLGALFALMLGVALHSLPAPLAVAFVAGVVAALGFALQRRAQRAKKEQQSSLEKARELVAADILGQRPALESAELGRMLGMSAEQADLLVAELDVDALLDPRKGLTQRLPEGEPLLDADAGALSGVPPTEIAPNADVTQMAPPLARLDRRS